MSVVLGAFAAASIVTHAFGNGGFKLSVRVVRPRREARGLGLFIMNTRIMHPPCVPPHTRPSGHEDTTKLARRRTCAGARTNPLAPSAHDIGYEVVKAKLSAVQHGAGCPPLLSVAAKHALVKERHVCTTAERSEAAALVAGSAEGQLPK